MIEQDYLLKIMQEFIDAIGKIMRRPDEDDRAAEARMQAHFDAVSHQFFQQPTSHFLRLEKEDILNDLLAQSDPRRTEGRAQMLAELFYRNALIKSSLVERLDLLEKSLYLFAYIGRTSRTYSWDRERKMADIRRRLDEFKTEG